ncbi:cytochrome P450 2D15-like [Ambystoma mexicanum]|uniref:cytochrome P450 2D15-like n=1 Tax=Ambystoma mexicanum TaxID=8296 RepID=UPI0037E7C39F
MELLSALVALLASFCKSLPLLGLFLATFLLCLDFLKRRKSWNPSITGPPSRPFVGNLLQLDFTNPPKSFTQLSKKYGSIFRYQMGWSSILVVNGYEAVKDALVNKSEDTADRPIMPLFEEVGCTENVQGIVFARYGQGWKDMRRFSLSTLRNFGLGKKSLEERVIEEASFLCTAFELKEGHPFDPQTLVSHGVTNVISSLLFGNRFEYDDQKGKKLLQFFQESLKAGSGLILQMLNLAPLLMKISWLVQKAVKRQKDIFLFLRQILKDHRESFDPNVTRDFMDAFLLEIEKVKDDPSSNICEQNLLVTTLDLYGAGTDTLSTTLRWALLYMLLYPDVQRRVHEEIDSVIGRDRKPTMEDQSNMPYTNAVIYEIQRCADLIPLAVPHMTYRDTEIQGYFIPKGVTLFINLSSVVKDETAWERPHQFYPEHFLDADGKLVKPEAFMPFGAGRRVCLGEQLARMELFLFFTAFLQRFTFTIPAKQARPREDPLFSLMHVPHPYQICAELR